MSLFISPFNEAVVPQSILFYSLVCNRSSMCLNIESCNGRQNCLHSYMHFLHPNILDCMHLIELMRRYHEIESLMQVPRLMLSWLLSIFSLSIHLLNSFTCRTLRCQNRSLMMTLVLEFVVELLPHYCDCHQRVR